MQLLETVDQLKSWRASVKGSIGFVPTMGALHAGHVSLIQKSRDENDLTISSIFVNPTQFDDPKDFEKYPKTWDTDVQVLKKESVNALFAPRKEALYPDGYRFQVHELEFSRELCGAHRPGHFDGVLSIVLKLLNLVAADKAYFGEKDYQQFLLIRDMAASFFLQTQIIACPTVREADGLAMSSRNLRLSAEERGLAPSFFKTLSSGRTMGDILKALSDLGFKVEYVEQKLGRVFGAVRLGDIRLIDNVPTVGERKDK